MICSKINGFGNSVNTGSISKFQHIRTCTHIYLQHNIEHISVLQNISCVLCITTYICVSLIYVL
jgi:hypothetical protein